MSLLNFRIRRNRRSGLFRFVVVLLVTGVVMAGCATSHKYKKVKAVPCPCEKVNHA